MNTLLALRYAAFAFFIILNVLVGSIAAWNLGLALVAGAQPSVRGLEIFLISLGTFGVIFQFAILSLEVVKRETPTSRVLFELIWVATFALAHLAGALAFSLSKSLCADDRSTSSICDGVSILTGVTWVAAATYILYFTALLSIALFRARNCLSICSASVKDLGKFPASNSSLDNSTLPGLNRANTYDSDVTVVGREKEKIKTDLEAYPIVPKSYGYYHPNAQLGVDAISQAPIYDTAYLPAQPNMELDSSAEIAAHPSAEPYHTAGYLSYQLPNPPQPAAVRHPYATAGGKSTATASYSGIITGYHSNAFSSSESSPSPAVISVVQKVSRPHQASNSNSRPRSGSLPLRSSRLLDRQSPDQEAPRNALDQPREASAQGRIFTRAHSKSFSGDVTFSSRRPHKHRPPPLNLSALSNIQNADRR